jgi:protein-S-isoprenylcysteine O-methyltransferase Ste14
MAWLAIFGYMIFAALAFGARFLVHYRRTGSTGFRGLFGRVGSLEWLGGALFVVALVAGPAAPILDLTGTLRPLGCAAAALWRVCGVALYVTGVAGILWAQFAMSESWRIGVDRSERTRLALKGPFRFVRNPIFTSMTAALAGVALMVPNIAAGLALLALVAGLETHVRVVEEPYLLRTHGEAYRRYLACTGRFLPGIGRKAVQGGAGAGVS